MYQVAELVLVICTTLYLSQLCPMRLIIFTLLAVLAAFGRGFTVTPSRAGSRSFRHFSSSNDDVPSDVSDNSPSDSPTPSSPTSSDLPALKSSLYALCASCDRGFAASPSDRSAVEELLLQISALSPVPDPTAGLAEGASNAPLKKCWRLVYTSASDVSSLSANPSAAVGGVYQDARDLPVIVNVIDLTPRALKNLPPGPLADALETSTRVKVRTQVRMQLWRGEKRSDALRLRDI